MGPSFDLLLALFRLLRIFFIENGEIDFACRSHSGDWGWSGVGLGGRGGSEAFVWGVEWDGGGGGGEKEGEGVEEGEEDYCWVVERFDFFLLF